MRWCGFAVLVCVRLLGGAEIPGEWRAALEGISAARLRAHVSFLASDLLEGRDTPSRGLAIAAEYIAAEFRGAGLEPGVEGSYFQTAHWRLRKPGAAGAEMIFDLGGQIVRPARAQVIVDASKGFEVRQGECHKLELTRPGDWKPGSPAGRVVLTAIPVRAGDGGGPGPRAARLYRRFLRTLAAAEPALVIVADPVGSFAQRMARPMLIDPEGKAEELPPAVIVTDPVVAERIAGAEPGAVKFLVSARCGEPVVEPVALRNVVGVLPGADPALRRTAVVVSAHYDHLGEAPTGDEDRIFNGANDDASGTAAVLEIAAALAGLERRPRRSIVFLALFGEERGMLGSGYYVRHPVVRLADTVANLNIEQVGRSDSTEGTRLRRASLTGYQYSTVSRFLEEAGAATGIDVYEDKRNSDAYFVMSDNIRFAERGVPAHSVTTAFLYPDYHRPGDHWDKLDYENMAAVTRMIALGALLIADSPAPPRWNDSRPAARRYAEAAGNDALR